MSVDDSPYPFSRAEGAARILFHDADGEPARPWLCFPEPRQVIVARRAEEVGAAWEQVEAGVEGGAWAAGFLAYEAAPGFDSDLLTHPPAAGGPPLSWWGLFDPPRRVPHPFAVGQGGGDGGGAALASLRWSPLLSAEQHRAAVQRIHGHIEAGDTYQVNLTFPWLADFVGDPWQLFTELWLSQRPSYSAFLDPTPGAADGWALCSVSPELFFAQQGEKLVTRPMKGTSPRGRYPAEDAARLAELHNGKNRAENLMIVDMMRNDLGRIAEPGSVRVRRLFAQETYPTVHQLVSEVVARSSASPFEVLRALFPCASITGAPKIRTMQLIRQLEATPRGPYTGTLGFIDPQGRAQFSVAIRTAIVSPRGSTSPDLGSPDLGNPDLGNPDLGKDGIWPIPPESEPPRVVRYGTGGGIVWDSEAAEEYRECRIKARVLGTSGYGVGSEFELFETLLYRQRSGFFLLRRHLERLAASARYFAFPFDLAAVERALEEVVASSVNGFSADGLSADGLSADGLSADDPSRAGVAGGPGPQPLRLRVRLWLDRRGRARVEADPWPCQGRRVWRVGLDDRPVDERDPFLFHKTTRRQRYEEAMERFPDLDEVLLWNRRGELTETTRCNIVLRRGQEWLTPPVESGLLAGTYRAELLDRGRLEEAVSRPGDLGAAEQIYLINSLRGIVRAELVSPAEGAAQIGASQARSDLDLGADPTRRGEIR